MQGSISKIYRRISFVLIGGAMGMALSAGAQAGAKPETATAAATPTFAPAPGTYTAAQSVTLADTTTGAKIYYTTNGTVPTAASTLYTKAIGVTVTTTIKAIATATGYGTSAVASGTYTITPPAATPTFSPAPGTFTTTQQVTLADATKGATIYYTVDGSQPTAKSSVYSKAIGVSATETINAIATATGYSTSATATATYTITPPAATPGFSPAPGTFTTPQVVSLTDATSNATIYYTVDGTTPTVKSAVYQAPLNLQATTTIKAIATAANHTLSAVASGTFTINLPAAATPAFSPAPGVYSSAQTVTLSDTTQNASIYYTLNGSVPTAASTLYTAPIPSVSGTVNAIATAPGYKASAVATGVYSIGGPVVTAVLSTDGLAKKFAAQPSLQFTSSTGGANPVYVDEMQTYQTIEGYGASFTDTAGYNLNEVATPTTRAAVMSDLFTRKGNGIGLSFVRNPMGASDLARTVYSYDDMPAGQTDPTLAKFSIAHDQVDIIPLVLEAKQLNPDLKVMANPWSAPGWMKGSGSMIGTAAGGQTLLPADYTAFANYFVKYIQAYQNAGIPIDYISIQNEPGVLGDYPGMEVDAPTATNLIANYFLPALQANNLNTRILLFDWNYDGASYPEAELGNATILASDQVAGVAWHGYSGTAGAIQTVLNMFPTKGAWETEHSGGTWNGDQFRLDFQDITQVMRSGGKSFVKWSLAVNQNYGPDLTSEGVAGGCNTCYGVVTINSGNGSATYPADYYTLGHFSKWVLSGAQRVYSSNATGIFDSAYVNPDGTRALVAFNDSTASQTFQVQWGGQSFSYTLPSHAAVTFSWSGVPAGSAIPMSAKGQIEASGYSLVSGLQTESTTDVNGGYDLGYASSGSYAVYKNVDFGTSVSGLSARVSTENKGASLEFHLDSPAGALVSTVTVPDTGGWQNWQTATATASGASGVHDLYVVYKGAALNLNWFQFK
jgi:glucosylceramidase